MRGTTEAFAEKLQGDSEIVTMLGLNPHFTDKSSTPAKVNSILPVDQVKGQLNTPFITIQEGNENFIGYTVKRQSMYIRVYNDLAKGYIEINTVLDRVRELFHRQDLVLSDRVNVQCISEGRLPSLIDEAFELKYKEEQYSITVL